MKYRLIDRNISDLVADETFSEHKTLFRANSAMHIVKYVEDHPKLRRNDLSVMTVVRGNCITLFSLSSMKWIK